MSLINRMLGDLAARQAPGAEALGGVRLNEPLADASASLSSRTVAVLMAVAILAALLAWWLWPKAISMPAPRVRGADTPAATAAPVPATDSTSSASIGDSSASLPPMPTRLSLKLDMQLAATPSGTGQNVNAIEAAATPSVIEAAPRAERGVRPPPMKAESSLAWNGDASTGAGSRSSSHPQRGKSSTTRKQPEATKVEPAVPLVAEQPITARKLRARSALAAGDPATALEALGSTANDTDMEIAALRAAALQRLGRHPDAARSYERLAGLEPDEAAHWVGLAISLESLRRRDEARSAYQRGLASPRIATSLQAFARARLTAMEKP